MTVRITPQMIVPGSESNGFFNEGPSKSAGRLRHSKRPILRGRSVSSTLYSGLSG